MRFEFDAFDVMAFVAIVLILGGLAAWQWQAAVVALGCGMLAVYVVRELVVRPATPPDKGK